MCQSPAVPDRSGDGPRQLPPEPRVPQDFAAPKRCIRVNASVWECCDSAVAF